MSESTKAEKLHAIKLIGAKWLQSVWLWFSRSPKMVERTLITLITHPVGVSALQFAEALLPPKCLRLCWKLHFTDSKNIWVHKAADGTNPLIVKICLWTPYNEDTCNVWPFFDTLDKGRWIGTLRPPLLEDGWTIRNAMQFSTHNLVIYSVGQPKSTFLLLQVRS